MSEQLTFPAAFFKPVGASFFPPVWVRERQPANVQIEAIPDST
jgi:hypothetical protein